MKLCIPISQKNGKLSRVDSHFGRAPLFSIYDFETDSITCLLNPVTSKKQDNSHPCLPVSMLIKKKVKVVICKKMCSRAAQILEKNGIVVFHTDKSVLQEALESFMTHPLSKIPKTKTCSLCYA